MQESTITIAVGSNRSAKLRKSFILWLISETYVFHASFQLGKLFDMGELNKPRAKLLIHMKMFSIDTFEDVNICQNQYNKINIYCPPRPVCSSSSQN